VTTRKFSNEMRFHVELLCCDQSNILSRSRQLVHCAHCVVHAHQILPAISENALTSFKAIRYFSCYSWTLVHSHNSTMKPQSGLNQLQTHSPINSTAPNALKEKGALFTSCLRLSHSRDVVGLGRAAWNILPPHRCQRTKLYKFTFALRGSRRPVEVLTRK